VVGRAACSPDPPPALEDLHLEAVAPALEALADVPTAHRERYVGIAQKAPAAVEEL
jgi:hypothetical protein